ncbi:MAG: AAA family ATPase [Cyanobacteria bacterium J06555_13]
MQESQGSNPEIAATDFIEQFFEDSTLSDEQKNAIATSCTSTDQVMGWQGSAGAGKTYGLNAFREIAEAHGYTVSGYAPSSAAAHELAESLSIQTETVARLLISEPLAEEAGQKKLWLIDEAGLLSMRGANALLSRAKEQNARVVLVGDTKQLSSVEAGNPFRSLQAGGMTTVHLDEARRQKKAELRQAVQLMANGQVSDSIDVLNTTGHINEIPEETQQITRIVSDFLGLAPEEQDETLLLAGTNANRLQLTEQIRQGLQQEGRLGADTFTMKSLQRKDLTVVQGRYAKSYEPGNVIVPIRDYKRQHLVRNECYVVRMVDASSNTLTLETPDGKLIQIDPRVCDRKASYKVLEEAVAPGDRLKWTKNNRVEETRNGQGFTILSLSDEGLAQTIDGDGNHREVDLSNYQHIDYNWIATTYSSQGKTADRVMALLDSATINKETFYVATSRAKHDLQLYTADIGKLREKAEKSKANENVSDYLLLLELTDDEQSVSEPGFTAQATANHSGGVAGDVGRSVEYRQQATTRGSQSELSETVTTRSGAPRYGGQFGSVLDGVEEYLRQEEFREEVVRVGEAAPAINSSAEHVERAAGAATRLNEQVKRTARRKLTGSRWPRKQGSRGPVGKPKLREQTNIENPAPAPARSAPVQTQPSSPVLQPGEERGQQQPITHDIQIGDSQTEENPVVENISDYWTLFGVVDYEPREFPESSTTTDNGRGLVEVVGENIRKRQRAATEGALTERAMTAETGSADNTIQNQADTIESIEAHLRQEEWEAHAAQVEAAAPALIQSIQQIEEATGAAAQLHRTVEHTRQQRRIKGSSRWPQLTAKQPTPPPVLKTSAAQVLETTPATQISPLATPPASAERFDPVELKPPAPGVSLQQQLNNFAAVLGYAPGDRLYVRALLPKNLSNELALKQNLKFEIEEHGKKRLIPNTRRGYLTVGSWEFTHIRKGKEPAVHADGLKKLTELNQEGRGIYFVVHPGGERDNEITQARSLFWENDDKTKAEQIEQARTAGLPLGAVVETHKSIHCYAPLAAPIEDMDEWKALQERLIQKMESDPAIRNSSRLMRLPGLDHVRVEGKGTDEQLHFTPVELRHIDQAANASIDSIADKLPEWDKLRWMQETTTENGKKAAYRRGEEATHSRPVENLWDIRNFSQYLNGDQVSQNGWLQVQCPSHGGEGHSGNSLHINQATGQYKCHGGCDTQSIYKAAWTLAETRGWQPPKLEAQTSTKGADQTQENSDRPKPVRKGGDVLQSQWTRYSNGVVAPAGPGRDLEIARKAFADNRSRKQVLELLARNSPKARKLYEQHGSTPAYNYVSSVVAEAVKQLKKQKINRMNRSTEL